MWKPTTLIFHLLETNPQLQEVFLDHWHTQETCIWANERGESSANYRWSNWEPIDIEDFKGIINHC